MSNDVQSHEGVAERASGGERRSGVRHAAGSLGSVTARIIGGSPVDLVNFSSRGVLFECDSRLLIGARASVRITTPDANLIVTGRVVRSRVKGLVNGALRYDAALVLDTELALTPAILAAVPAVSDDMVSFESAFEDPSPVEAYVAESEASLLEVTTNSGLPLDAMAAVASVELEGPPVEIVTFERQPSEDDALAEPSAPVVFETNAVTFEPDAVAETPDVDSESNAVAFETNAVSFETTAAAEAAAEPVAFEADAEIAFEPAVDFAFDEAPVSFDAFVAPEPVEPVESVEPAAVVEEPAGTSMFDATYIPPVYETESAVSQFRVTPPTPAPESAASSFFDARPSETYGEAAVTAEPPPLPVASVAPAEAGVGVAAIEAVEPIEFESEIAFEAEDAVQFDAFDDAPAEPVAIADAAFAAPDPVVAAPLESIDVTVSIALAPVPVPDAAPEPAIDEPVIETAAVEAPAPLDELPEPAVAVVADDRVLLQFAATVPQDLADLRRIAADNQW